jgi:hypothetical protein
MDEQPLLEAGLHDFKISEIGNHFLKSFPSSTTRRPLIDGLSNYVNALTKVGIPVEIWIDGSFTTNKTDPNDIDLVIFASATLINNLPEDKQKLLGVLIDRNSMKQNFGCDVLFSPSENNDMRSYWRGWYGFDRNENPKGIARVMVTP